MIFEFLILQLLAKSFANICYIVLYDIDEINMTKPCIEDFDLTAAKPGKIRKLIINSEEPIELVRDPNDPLYLCSMELNNN
jgi:hypothetical protein